MITPELEAKLAALLQRNLLDDETLENDEPWGEDGSIHAFEQGQKFGAHDLAEEILDLLNSTSK